MRNHSAQTRISIQACPVTLLSFSNFHHIPDNVLLKTKRLATPNLETWLGASNGLYNIWSTPNAAIFSPLTHLPANE